MSPEKRGVPSIRAPRADKNSVRVPFVDLETQYAALRDEIEPVVLGICERQEFILGPEVDALETEIASYVRARHAIGCASGTDALVLALRVLGVGPGDEVVTTAFSFVACAGAVALVGARPVFADIEPESFNLDPEQLEKTLTPRTKAILAVDLFGQCADWTALLAIADQHGVPVIEDAAQSLGAEHAGRRAGEMATITTYSFYPSKNLGGFGDGGLIAVMDDERAALLRRLRVHGQTAPYVHDPVGTNSRLDALQAAVLRIKLRHLDDWVEARQRLAAEYDRCLEASDLGRWVETPRVGPRTTRHVFNQYTLRVQDRDALREHLAQKGVQTAVYYPVPLHLQPCFRDLGHRPGHFPQAEAAAAQVLSLPIYPELSVTKVGFVVECITEFYRSR